jgi:hypothetical protein
VPKNIGSRSAVSRPYGTSLLFLKFLRSARQIWCSARLRDMRPQPLICVTDVEVSSQWYQRLLGCRGAHGGRQYEQLVKDGLLILQLHNFEVEHHHGPIGNRADRPMECSATAA